MIDTENAPSRRTMNNASGRRCHCETSSAPETSSTQGTIGATNRGTPIDAACAGQRRPMEILAPPARHMTTPRTTEEARTSMSIVKRQVDCAATPVTLPRKNTIASETSARCSKSTTRPWTNQ